MSDGHTDSRASQTTIDTYERVLAGVKPKPTQNNYQIILDELFWIRKEIEEIRQDIFDHSEVMGYLGRKIEEWVGVAEEDE